MRYLKTYKIFESLGNSDILATSKDILRDLEDDGLDVSIMIYELNGYYRLVVYITLYPMDDEKEFNSPVSLSIFKYSDVQKPVEHLLSFLKENGYRLESAYNVVNYTPVNFSFNTVKPDDVMGRFELRFDKFIK